MLNAKAQFEKNIAEIRALGDVHNYLDKHVGNAMDFTDLLRSQLVYSVSAYDALIHDLIRIGMREIFLGLRPPTPKYSAEVLTLQQHLDLKSATLPPPESLFESIVRGKLKYLSFQTPDKVCDGLSLIWPESDKWQRIADAVGSNKADHRTKQTLLIGRRNAIVHEYDIDPVTQLRQPIDAATASDAIDFFQACGTAIADLVT